MPKEESTVARFFMICILLICFVNSERGLERLTHEISSCQVPDWLPIRLDIGFVGIKLSCFQRLRLKSVVGQKPTFRTTTLTWSFVRAVFEQLLAYTYRVDVET